MERHPLFPTVMLLAEAIHRCEEALHNPSQERLRLLDDALEVLDSTRHLRKEACLTKDDIRDAFMCDTIRYLRARLCDAYSALRPLLETFDACARLISQLRKMKAASPMASAREEGGNKRGHAADDSTTNRRGALPARAVAVLKEWLRENAGNPYPEPEAKDMLAEKTGLSLVQINYWFINARRRYLPKLAPSVGKVRKLSFEQTASFNPYPPNKAFNNQAQLSSAVAVEPGNRIAQSDESGSSSPLAAPSHPDPHPHPSLAELVRAAAPQLMDWGQHDRPSPSTTSPALLPSISTSFAMPPPANLPQSLNLYDAMGLDSLYFSSQASGPGTVYTMMGHNSLAELDEDATLALALRASGSLSLDDLIIHLAA